MLLQPLLLVVATRLLQLLIAVVLPLVILAAVLACWTACTCYVLVSLLVLACSADAATWVAATADVTPVAVLLPQLAEPTLLADVARLLQLQLLHQHQLLTLLLQWLTPTPKLMVAC